MYCAVEKLARLHALVEAKGVYHRLVTRYLSTLAASQRLAGTVYQTILVSMNVFTVSTWLIR